MHDMPGYITSGFQAFFGASLEGLLIIVPSLAVIWNVAFNISIINAVRSVGIANVIVALTAAVPVTVYMFTLPLPLIGSSPLPGDLFIPGTVLLMLGQVTYNLKSVRSAFNPASR